jgi:catechol 2,3-dioxygenase-like lactoylglutathione lyase family enzyme
MITRIAHVCIIARDLGETEQFYCGTLGFRKVFDFQKAGEIIGFYLEVGGSNYIEVFRGDPAGSACPIRHICLETQDIDGVKKRLADNGVAATDKKLGCDQSWQIWCKDPNGVDIEFHQYTEKSLQRLGGVAVIP